jgi:hypothetical protein
LIEITLSQIAMLNKKNISKKYQWFWFFPLLVLLIPFRSKAGDGADIPKFKKPLSKSGMPYTPNGPFKSPFANPDFGDPAQVKVGFLLKSVTSYNMKEGRFEANFFLSYSSDKPMPDGIRPHFTNGIVEEDSLVIQIADEPTFKLWSFHATFFSVPDLRNFPFDHQKLEIGIEEDDVGIDQMQFVVDEEYINLDSDFVLPGWEVRYQEVHVLEHFYPDRFEHDDLYYPRFVFRLGISRYGTHAIFTVYVPAFIIMLIALSGIWLPGSAIESRINSSAPMLAAAVFFHYSLTTELPPTAYMTRADKIMMGVYFGLMVNMFATWAFFFFDKKHEEKIYLLGRYIVPPTNLLLYLLGCFI